LLLPIGIGALTAVVLLGLLGLGGWLWMRSSLGHRFARHQLETLLAERLPGLRAERIGGSMYSDVKLEGVTLRDANGQLLFAAQSVHARFGLRSLLRRRPHLSLVEIKKPFADVSTPERRRQLLAAADRLLAGMPIPEAIHIDSLVVRDGRVVFARGAPAQASLAATLAASPSQVNLSLRALELTAGRTREPIRITGSAQGPKDNVRLAFAAQTQYGTLDVNGVLDLERGRADATLLLHDLAATFGPGAEHVRASGEVRIVLDWPAKHTGQLAADGAVKYVHLPTAPSLQERTPALALEQTRRYLLPSAGGRIELHVRARVESRRLRGHYRVLVADPGAAAKVMSRRPLPRVGTLELQGSFDQGLPGGRLRVASRRRVVE
jgi:hypothetical protein